MPHEPSSNRPCTEPVLAERLVGVVTDPRTVVALLLMLWHPAFVIVVALVAGTVSGVRVFLSAPKERAPDAAPRWPPGG